MEGYTCSLVNGHNLDTNCVQMLIPTFTDSITS